MHWLRIDADESDQTRESTLDMYDVAEPKESSDKFDILSPVSDTTSSIADEDIYEAHVALAMRDLGYDENNKEPILKGIMELIVKYVFILVMYNYMHLNIFTVINIVYRGCWFAFITVANTFKSPQNSTRDNDFNSCMVHISKLIV